jgi:hypothetical protein
VPSVSLCTFSRRVERWWTGDAGTQRRKRSHQLVDLLLRDRSRDRQLALERLVEHGTRLEEERLESGWGKEQE